MDICKSGSHDWKYSPVNDVWRCVNCDLTAREAPAGWPTTRDGDYNRGFRDGVRFALKECK
jgi:hypothetical protein